MTDWTTGTVEREYYDEPTIPTKAQIADAGMRIICGVPMERTIMQEAFFGFLHIAVQGWPFAELAYTRNDIARYKLSKHLLESDFTHLLMMDSDHRHPHDIVQRLARWPLNYSNVQIAGGLCFRRGEPFDPCAFVYKDGHYRRLAEWPSGLVQVDALGTGAILIARQVFETIPPPWYDYKYEDLEGWPGTDMSFARYCEQYHIGQYLDTTTVSPHLGVLSVDADTYQAHLKQLGAI
jgi:hypothetical protein